MASLAIVRATEKDVEGIISLFDSCRKKMIDDAIFQWDDGYPTKNHILDDIAASSLFCIQDNNIVVGVVTVDDKQSPEYEAVSWQIQQEPVLVVHRMAVNADFQGKGIGKYLCRFAENYARAHGFRAIRLDCFQDNPVSNHLYQLLGYSKADGHCFFHGNEVPFLCYEKEVLP